MPKYEYKILHGKPLEIFEKQLNDLAKDGWVVISCSTAASFWTVPMATVVLQRPIEE